MLGFSSEGITGSQDLGAWKQSFSAAFSNPEVAIPVAFGGASHSGVSQFESNTEMTNVSVMFRIDEFYI
jgi:hypothetical protein